MAIYRDLSGEIDKQEFENHLKADTRQEGYIDIIVYTPNSDIPSVTSTSTDKLSYCDISTITDINKYDSSTIATLEENLWLLNGRFVIYQGNTIDGYISDSISDENGEFQTKPTISLQLAHPSEIENFSVILNSAVPTGYPKDITVYCYDINDTLIGTSIKKNIEWEEDTGKIDEEGQPIYKTVLLDTLPSVNFEINKTNVDHIIVECGNTRFKKRRIRISSMLFGKTTVFNQNQIFNVDYLDKTSYVCDTLPSRIFKFDVNNYDGTYNIDNPNNEYINLDKHTIVRFRIGYNVAGYRYDNDGRVIMENGRPVVDPSENVEEIEWDNWKELRLIDVSANADKSATFTCGSVLDVMDEIYTRDLYGGDIRFIQSVVEDILRFEGLDLNTVEWSSDGIKKPIYINNVLQPYEQWTDTYYNFYQINTSLPEVPCKQILQLLAFSVGATLLIKDNGHIKFANLNILDSSTFTNHYEWTYHDFISIPAAEQLEHVSVLKDISLPKYSSTLDRTGEESIMKDGTIQPHCTIVSTVTCTTADTEITYSDCYPVGGRIKANSSFSGSIAYIELYNKRGIVRLSGFSTGDEVEIEILGYPIKTKRTQERDTTSDSLVLDSKIMMHDQGSYNPDGTVARKDEIKRKYLEWYKKKFKYSISTRGEPLVNAGDYGIIQTQFTNRMNVYILQNHWSFDGAWSGDMEVIALDENMD